MFQRAVLYYYGRVTPLDLHEFIVACVGASASFIGLLFVGLSVVQEKTEGNRRLRVADISQAQGAFSALINIFFVTLSGLLPQANLGIICIVMGMLGLLSCWRLRSGGSPRALVISGAVYASELILGAYSLYRHGAPINVGYFQAIIFFLFGLGLYRAWKLTGIH
jgi:hypothetical protein